MLHDFPGWLLCVSLISLLWFYHWVRRGPVAALGAAVVMSFACPVWLQVDFGGLPFDVRTTVTCIAMAGYLVHPQGKIYSPLTLLDFAIAALCICHAAADSFAVGISPVLPLRAYGEWALPYVAGRFAIRDRNDLHQIAPWAVGVITVLSIAAVGEAVTGVNPWEWIFGNRPEELFRRSSERLGFKRAFGPTSQPIFLGMIIAVLLPWVISLWQSASSSTVRLVTFSAAGLAVVGTVSTISRTPALTILGTIILVLAMRFQVLRLPLAAVFTFVIIGFAAFPDQVTIRVSEWTGGIEKPRLIEVDGEAVITSSSKSRLHVFGIYRDALVKAGPFGYGSKATTGFPLQIPGMEGSFKSANLFYTVDNAYVLLTLRFGWLGGVCLVILFLTAIGTGLSLFREHPEELFPGAIAGLLVVVAGFSLMLVFMSYDFGFLLLWTFGILSGLASGRIASVSGMRE